MKQNERNKILSLCRFILFYFVAVQFGCFARSYEEFKNCCLIGSDKTLHWTAPDCTGRSVQFGAVNPNSNFNLEPNLNFIPSGAVRCGVSLDWFDMVMSGCRL